MGTEILRPHDCLIKHNIFSPPAIHHRRKGCYGHGYVNPRFGNKKPSPAPVEERRFDNSVKNNNCKSNSSSNLAIGRVRILKRGESPQTPTRVECIDRRTRRISADDVTMSRINRLGTDSSTAPKKIRLEDLKGGDAGVDMEFVADVYAGSAFSMSPSPRSLPLPSFFNRIRASETVDDSATRDLRRLLRLE